jgi:hypothetical protein
VREIGFVKGDGSIFYLLPFFSGLPFGLTIKDLHILLIINLVPEDLLTVVSPGQSVKYMFRWGYPGSSGHALTLPALVSSLKGNRTVPFYTGFLRHHPPIVKSVKTIR